MGNKPTGLAGQKADRNKCSRGILRLETRPLKAGRRGMGLSGNATRKRTEFLIRFGLYASTAESVYRAMHAALLPSCAPLGKAETLQRDRK